MNQQNRLKIASICLSSGFYKFISVVSVFIMKEIAFPESGLLKATEGFYSLATMGQTLEL